MTEKTYHGSCHCQAVTYKARMDLTQPSFKCNCSVCAKSRNWLMFIPADNLTVLTGEAALKDYQFNKKVIHHHFCGICGISPFGRGQQPDGSKMAAIKLNTLDDASAEELAAVPVTYADGRHDDFSQGPPITSYL